MGAVAADLVALANHRISNGELRAIPYSQRFGARRLDVNPGSVRRALDRLQARGVIAAVGSLPGRTQVTTSTSKRFDIERVQPWQLDAPPPWDATGAMLWALRVVSAVPAGPGRVERADRVGSVDIEPRPASETAGLVREPHPELCLEAGVALADLGVR
jgi:DNA-binding transcriptional MocR family regulator